MEERLFKNHTELKFDEVSAVINELIKNSINDLDTISIIEKWNTFPVLYYEKDYIKTKFIEEVCYIDELLLPKLDKVLSIITLTYMMEIKGLNIEEIDVNSLFVLVYYFKNADASTITSGLKIFNNPDLLLKIREKFLDIEKRDFLMKHVQEASKKGVKNYDDKTEIDNFINKVIKYINKNDAYDIMETSGYNDYIKEKELKQLETNVEEEKKKE